MKKLVFQSLMYFLFSSTFSFAHAGDLSLVCEGPSPDGSFDYKASDYIDGKAKVRFKGNDVSVVYEKTLKQYNYSVLSSENVRSNVILYRSSDNFHLPNGVTCRISD
jgi:hypothetical protein